MKDKNGVLTCSMARGPEPLFLIRLRQLDILNNKHVLPVYLRAYIEHRLEVLRGLMDSDGSVSRSTGRAEFTSISEHLSRGALELVLSLGQKATRKKGDAMLYGRRISDKYRVFFTPTIGIFSLPRKVAVLKDRLERRGNVTLPRNRAEKPWLGREISAVKPRRTESGTIAVRAGPRRKWP